MRLDLRYYLYILGVSSVDRPSNIRSARARKCAFSSHNTSMLASEPAKIFYSSIIVAFHDVSTLAKNLIPFPSLSYTTLVFPSIPLQLFWPDPCTNSFPGAWPLIPPGYSLVSYSRWQYGAKSAPEIEKPRWSPTLTWAFRFEMEMVLKAKDSSSLVGRIVFVPSCS
jgi:hypothetical protein